jgi:dienelactone hydrolase
MATKPNAGHRDARGDAVGAEPIGPPLIVHVAGQLTALAPGDIAFYKAQLPGWREHQGKHVLIYGGQEHGFFASRREARREGFRRFGPVAFLVKQVDLDEKPRPLAAVVR